MPINADAENAHPQVEIRRFNGNIGETPTHLSRRTMNDIQIAQIKAQDAIDLLKEAVLTIVTHETETGSGITRAGIRNWLEIGKENYPTPEGEKWDAGQIVYVVLLLLQEDGKIDRSSADEKKWVRLPPKGL